MATANTLWRSLAATALVLVLSTGHARAAEAPPPLPALGAELSGLTVSGISSGAFMAVQFQVAHAQLVSGAGVIAGGPYYCAEGSIRRALTQCMAPSWWAALPSLDELRARAEAIAGAGRIDPLEHLSDDRVWLFSGGRDSIVDTTVMERLAAFYGQWIAPSAIRFVKLPEAGHAMISIVAPAANPCGSEQSPFINRCGDFDAAGEMLGYLLGRLRPAASTLSGEMLRFDQGAFVAGKAIDAGLADAAYAFVPQACHSNACRVHVVFHGCRQSTAQIGRRFVDGAGYNRWADSNRIIVLYPQVEPRYGLALGSWQWLNNPFGCWDWWGYSGSDYATQGGVQIKAVRAMLERLAAPRQPQAAPAARQP